jgi:nucleotide-binding universal stress UspA family protein
VVGVDGSANDDVVLPYAFAYALRHRIPLRAVHAYRTVVASAAGQVYAYLPHEDAAALVETAVARWARVYPEVLAECVALPGSAAQCLIEVSAGSSLVVVGCGGRRSRLAAAVRRPVGMALARRSRCPVVLAR